LNGTWKFCALPHQSYIQATVTSIVNESVLGMIDQVKTITFQAKNSSNVNLTNASYSFDSCEVKPKSPLSRMAVPQKKMERIM